MITLVNIMVITIAYCSGVSCCNSFKAYNVQLVDVWEGG